MNAINKPLPGIYTELLLWCLCDDAICVVACVVISPKKGTGRVPFYSLSPDAGKLILFSQNNIDFESLLVCGGNPFHIWRDSHSLLFVIVQFSLLNQSEDRKDQRLGPWVFLFDALNNVFNKFLFKYVSEVYLFPTCVHPFLFEISP